MIITKYEMINPVTRPNRDGPINSSGFDFSPNVTSFRVTVLERDTGRILSHVVVYGRTWDTLQILVDKAQPHYFPYDSANCGHPMYPTRHEVVPGKGQTSRTMRSCILFAAWRAKAYATANACGC